jgi:hypothetical protein
VSSSYRPTCMRTISLWIATRSASLSRSMAHGRMEVAAEAAAAAGGLTATLGPRIRVVGEVVVVPSSEASASSRGTARRSRQVSRSGSRWSANHGNPVQALREVTDTDVDTM